jgi:DNA-binding NtrC family response regulator
MNIAARSLLMKILVLDDIKEYLISLSQALGEDHEIITAVSLKEARERVNQTVQLAILDVRLSEEDMANRDGILFLSELKQKYPHIPVIMMSAYRDFDAVTDALNLGALHYLKKPISLKELKGLIAGLRKEGT